MITHSRVNRLGWYGWVALGMVAALAPRGWAQAPVEAAPAVAVQADDATRQQDTAIDDQAIPDGAIGRRPALLADLRELLPDPTVGSTVWRTRLERMVAQAGVDGPEDEPIKRFRKAVELAEGHMKDVDRAEKVYLSLGECIQRALANNLSVRIAGYSPAIETTRIVEAEAAFDPAVFLNYSETWTDQSSGARVVLPVIGRKALPGANQQSRTYGGGVRKLLPTGAQIEAKYSLTRAQGADALSSLIAASTGDTADVIDPSYVSKATLALRQPLLRGAGLDTNLAQINIQKKSREISTEQFNRQVQQTLFDVERRYWELVQARREVTIVAELLAQSEQMVETVVARSEYDTIPGLVPQTEAQVASRKAELIAVIATLHDAEDKLKNVLNDPQLNAYKAVSIVPTANPTTDFLVVDPTAELKTAMDYRTELHEARLQVEVAHIALGVAKNQALPQLDVSFQATFDGVGTNPNNSFDVMTGRDFIDYAVGLEFEWPIGNRGRRAAVRRARLEQSQAAMAVQRVIEDIVLDVTQAVRAMQTAYDQVAPGIKSAEASAEFHRTLQLRVEQMDQNTMNTILGAQESLAAARRSLLRAIVNYNIAVVNLERAKGTLLRYNNVTLGNAE